MFETGKLHKFCRTGNLEGVKVNIKKGGNPNAVVNSRHSSENCTPFEIACWYGQFEIVKYLVESVGVDPAFRDSKCITYAARGNNLELIKYLESKGDVNMNRCEDLAIVRSVECDSIDVFNYMYHVHDADPAAHNNHCIKLACLNGNLELVNILLRDDRVNPSSDGNVPIRRAIKAKRFDIVETLIKSKNFTPLFDSLFSKYLKDKDQTIVWTLVFRHVKDISQTNLKYINNLRLASILIESNSYKERLEYLDGKKVKRYTREELTSILRMM